jgi:hypothetical protein
MQLCFLTLEWLVGFLLILIIDYCLLLLLVFLSNKESCIYVCITDFTVVMVYQFFDHFDVWVHDISVRSYVCVL